MVSRRPDRSVFFLFLPTRWYFRLFLLMFLTLVAFTVSMIGIHWNTITVPRVYSTVDLENATFERFLHESIARVNANGTKYIVYDCSRAFGDLCSGWSDRIDGIVTTFIISILTKRKFLINFDNPCLLQYYLIPAQYDWRYKSSTLLNRTSSFHNFRSLQSNTIQKHILGGMDLNAYFKHDVVFVRFNWDFIKEFRQRPDIGYEILWITKYHQVDIYRYVYNFLFKLSPLSAHALNRQYRTKRKRNKIACAHIRFGPNPNMPKDHGAKSRHSLKVLWEYFDTLNKDEYDLFVASDADSVKKIAQESFPETMIDTPGKITHIDQPHNNDPVEGFLKQLLDFYILTECDILIIPSNSGFSKLAAFVRNKDEGMFCWMKEKLIPCSRYNITDILPDGKFGIKMIKMNRKQISG